MPILPDSTKKNIDDGRRGASAAGDTDRCLICCSDAASPGCTCCDDSVLYDAAFSRADIDPRHGVLVAHTGQVSLSTGEICLFPFRISPITSRIAWCPSQLVLVGSRDVPSVEVAWRELSPLENAIEGRRVHIDRAPTPRVPLVRDRLRSVDLVVGVDESSWDVIARLPVPDGADVAILADAAPWPDLYGREFAPIDSWWWNSSPGGVQSTLRLAALMGYLLDLGAPPEDLSPMEHLLAQFTPPDLSYPLSALEEEVRYVRA